MTAPAIDVLLVEDDLSFVVLTKTLIDHSGANVNLRAARTYAEALGELRDHPPDLALVDLGVPGNGRQLLDAIAEDHPDVYVVVVSGHDDESVVMDVLNRGAAQFRRKPLGNEAIVALIAQAGRRKRHQRERSEPPRRRITDDLPGNGTAALIGPLLDTIMSGLTQEMRGIRETVEDTNTSSAVQQAQLVSTQRDLERVMTMAGALSDIDSAAIKRWDRTAAEWASAKKWSGWAFRTWKRTVVALAGMLASFGAGWALVSKLIAILLGHHA